MQPVRIPSTSLSPKFSTGISTDHLLVVPQAGVLEQRHREAFASRPCKSVSRETFSPRTLQIGGSIETAGSEELLGRGAYQSEDQLMIRGHRASMLDQT